MLRIVYGVSGEGVGHASRAREMVSHLEGRGHQVMVVSYGKGYRDLSSKFQVFETEGLTIETIDNAVSVVKTFTENLARLAPGQKKLSELKHQLFDEFQPHCVITDFEPMTAYLANWYDLPLITIDNQHRMRYMEYPCPRHLRGSALVTETVIRSMVPRPDVSLVTTFYFGEVKNNRTFLFHPILRQEVLGTSPRRGTHVLVYLTRGFDTFIDHLLGFGRERFYVYGTGHSGREKNLVFKSFSRSGFLHDLAGCKAVMATAGFTLITETLYLGKPYLALPMKGQFEQELNGFLLENLGYGKNCPRVSSEAIGDFLYRLPEYRDRLKSYCRAGNHEITGKLDELLADDCALALEYHQARKS